MIKMAFFDVGETLIHDGEPMAGVPAAVEAISRFETAEGGPLVLGIISDYHMPSPPRTEEKIATLERQYREEVLAPSGLARFFEPFASHVTIASRAGVFKPDRLIFEVALSRSGTGAALAECLFVTENVTHLQKCKEYGMVPIRFGRPVDGMAGFEDWTDAPQVIANVVAPGHERNTALAARAALALRYGLVGFQPTGAEGQTLHGRADRLVQLHDPRLGALDGLYVEFPTDVTVELCPDGRVDRAIADAPAEDEVADTVNYVSSLVKSGKVKAPGVKAPGFGATHTVEHDAAGRMRLVRRGYKAV